MKNYKNVIQLIGIYSNPEFTILENGFKFVKLTMQTNETYISFDGSKRNETMDYLCYAFGKQYDILEKIKGSERKLALEGTLINQKLLNNGIETIETSIYISDLLILNNFN